MTTYSDEHWRMRHEVRYAQRLCERTARLYRRMQTAATFLGVIGGSAAVSASAPWMPGWAPLLGAGMLAVAGAAVLAIKPADRAALNDADVRKYAELLREALILDDTAFAAALTKARITDAPELEPLRAVAYNDLVGEIGRPDLVGQLGFRQRLLASLA